MKIATWNINGVRARIDTALAWVKEAAPEIVCLQEIKCEDAAFPSVAFEDLGYNVATHGQKGFNGVALLSKLPLEDIETGLAGDHRRRAGTLHRGGGLAFRLGAARGLALSA